MKVELNELEELGYAKREAFNSLRTNLSFCGEDIKVVMFTSCVPNEGKSSTVMQLARAFATDGKKVLFLDCDLRKSVLIGRHQARASKDEEIKGMTHFLTGKASMEEVICQTNVPGMDIVFAGRMTPNPTQLLGNHHFDELIAYGRENYDMVLIDTPPLGAVIDSVIIAPKTDGAVIVVEVNKCSYRFVRDVQKQLEVANIRMLGVVLNKMKLEYSGYYKGYYKGHYKGRYRGYYDNYYGEKEEKNAK